MAIARRVLAFAAVLFGTATVVAGARVLSGADPGYIVFRPLLLYNTVMGIAYVAAGVIAWRSARRGAHAAAVIFGLNVVALGAIGYLYVGGSAIAVESVRAMIFRTVVWCALFVGLALTGRTNRPSGPGRGV
jgi:hypothetical protein